MGLSTEQFMVLTPHEYKALMERYEERTFFERRLSGTVASVVADFSSFRPPKQTIQPLEWFPETQPPKREKPRKQRQRQFAEMLQKAGNRVGMVTKDAQGNIISDTRSEKQKQQDEQDGVTY